MLYRAGVLGGSGPYSPNLAEGAFSEFASTILHSLGPMDQKRPIARLEVPAADPSYHIGVVCIKIQEDDDMAQTDDTRGRTAEPSRYNFTILLGNGSFVDLANQLSNPQTVLPFLYSVLGAPLAAAGLIVPLNNIGGLFGRAIAAPLITAARFSKWHMAFGSLAVGASLAALALFIEIIHLNAVIALFLLVAGIVGIGQGVSSVAFQDVLGRALPQERRGPLLFTQTAIGGALAIAAAWGTMRLFKDAKPLDSHMTLIWISAAVLVLAFVCSILVREAPPAKTEASDRAGGFASEVRRGFTLTGRTPWFRRYLVAQVLFLSVTLATTFYSIHAASLHGGKAGSLSVFVIFSSLGLVLGGPLWSWLVGKGFRPVFILGGLASMSAAILALIIEDVEGLQSVLLHAPVFLLATLGYEAVTQGRQVYVVNMTTEEERPFFISISQTLLGALSIGVAALFGVLAQVKGEAWPLLAVLAMNAIAVLYVFALPPAEEAARVRGRIS
jgi:hypothetical protein